MQKDYKQRIESIRDLFIVNDRRRLFEEFLE